MSSPPPEETYAVRFRDDLPAGRVVLDERIVMLRAPTKIEIRVVPTRFQRVVAVDQDMGDVWSDGRKHVDPSAVVEVRQEELFGGHDGVHGDQVDDGAGSPRVRRHRVGGPVEVRRMEVADLV